VVEIEKSSFRQSILRGEDSLRSYDGAGIEGASSARAGYEARTLPTVALQPLQNQWVEGKCVSCLETRPYRNIARLCGICRARRTRNWRSPGPKSAFCCITGALLRLRREHGADQKKRKLRWSSKLPTGAARVKIYKEKLKVGKGHCRVMGNIRICAVASPKFGSALGFRTALGDRAKEDKRWGLAL
jgi:hypothetical protein